MNTLVLNQIPPYLKEQQPPQPQPKDYQNPEPATNSEISVDEFLEDTFKEAKIDAETLAQVEENPAAAENIYDPSAAGQEENKTLTDEDVKNQTAAFIRGRDMLQQRALAYLAKKPDDYKKFALEKYEFEWLCDVYGEYVGLLGKIPAWINILIAELCIMGPKIQQAFNIRKIEAENKRLKAELRQERAKKNKKEGAETEVRKNTKTQWKVDRNGYFEYTIGNNYIREGDRVERPILTPENYARLCEHNGKEYIDRIFKVNEDD